MKIICYRPVFGPNREVNTFVSVEAPDGTVYGSRLNYAMSPQDAEHFARALPSRLKSWKRSWDQNA